MYFIADFVDNEYLSCDGRNSIIDSDGLATAYFHAFNDIVIIECQCSKKNIICIVCNRRCMVVIKVL